VGKIDDGNLPVLPDAGLCGSELITVHFNQVDIIQIVKNISSNSLPGPDGFPPVLFKTLCHQLCNPLSVLF